MTTLCRMVGLATVVCLGVPASVAAQQPGRRAALALPAAGTFARGAEFKGTISISRFERRGNEIIAVGFVTGVLTHGNRTLGTAVAGEMTWPVVVNLGRPSLAGVRAPAGAAPEGVATGAGIRPASNIVRVQAETCSVVHVALGPQTVNLLGVDVTLGAVSFDIAGMPGTPLGDLVCSVSDLLGNVAGLVDVLNSILGLLIGLLGGLTGGLGGAVVPATLVAGIG